METTQTTTQTQKAKTTRVDRHIYYRNKRYVVEVYRKGLPKPNWGSFPDIASARVMRDKVLALAEAEGLIIDLIKAKNTRPDKHIYPQGKRYIVKINRKGLDRSNWGIFPDRASARRRRDEVLARLEAGAYQVPDYNNNNNNR